ncbi:ABC transporter permease [Streptomyces acidicola]|uniref:ABC transporter permease n=1 Tax=Streptomyces acidicola TaxID=2596892 RepID=UPI002AD2725C|nr:ABC transporter permease [Streptomyces acidicola]
MKSAVKSLPDRATGWLARAVIVFLYVPIVVVVVLSFNGSDVTYKWAGFSTRWYGVLADDTDLLSALRISAEVGVASATLATAGGLLAAMGMARLGRRFRVAFSGGLFLPLVIPEIVLGVALLAVFGTLRADLGLTTLVLGHLVVTLPYAALIVLGAHGALDPALDEAAADLGCNAWQGFRRVTLPLLRQALVAAWLLCFTISFGNIVMSTFTSGVGTTTLPLRVYSLLKGGLTPEINALGTLLVLFTFLIVLGAGLRQMRRILVGGDRTPG